MKERNICTLKTFIDDSENTKILIITLRGIWMIRIIWFKWID